MPPEGPPLTDQEISVLRLWIDQGAPWPEEPATSDARPDGGQHWAFQPIRAVPIPAPGGMATGHPIDAFVATRLSEMGLLAAAEADRTTLIRRLSFDLVGLPPIPEQVDQFLNDQSPDAYERLVDQLLASPHYGERWGRHWLDAAHYADSGGFESDTPRIIWPYRDWVIAALNADVSFDQFVIEQLAGDLLPNATLPQRIATGFLLNSPQDGPSEPSRVDALMDRINTVSTVLMGLTLACAQCHEHKFDPLSQRDFYRLFAFLNDADERVLELGPPDELARRDAIRAQRTALEQERDRYLESLAAQYSEWERQLTAEEKDAIPKEVRTVLAIAPAQRSADQQKKLGAALSELRDPGYRQRTTTIEGLTAQLPAIPTTLVLQGTSVPRDTRILIRGELTNPGVSVEPGVPTVLPTLAAERRLNRLDLARWMFAPENPLTSRVTVNRVWQHFFGLGLVETENDFGTRGDLPTHPELLDWLALRFAQRGWHLKDLHRLIVTSATYRQQSVRVLNQDAIDPRNRMLARQARLRLEAEIIRDTALSASGLLAPRIGGPSVFPAQPAGVLVNRATPAEWPESSGEDRYRRGLYTHFFRLTPHPYLPLFDSPDSLAACTRRRSTNTPLQALTLLNDPWFLECSRALARRALHEASGADDAALLRAFRLCLARSPSAEECEELRGMLHEFRGAFAADRSAAKLVAATDDDEEAVRLAAWIEISRTLFNLDEFITRE